MFEDSESEQRRQYYIMLGNAAMMVAAFALTAIFMALAFMVWISNAGYPEEMHIIWNMADIMAMTALLCLGAMPFVVGICILVYRFRHTRKIDDF